MLDGDIGPAKAQDEPTQSAQQAEPGRAEPGEERKPLLRQAETSASLSHPEAAFVAVEGLPEEPSTTERQPLELEAGVDQASIMKRINWHILPIFFGLAMLCAMDRANLSFASPQLNHDLHFSDEVYGLGSGIFFVGYAIVTIPSTFICARVGAPIFLGSILVMWGLVASLFAVMQNRWQFFILRFILGLTESGAYPGMWYLLHKFYSESELGVAYTIIATASSLSGLAGGPLAAELLDLDGTLHMHGWQWLFLLEGIPAVFLGIGILVYLAKSPEDARFLSPEEKAWFATRKQEETASLDVKGSSPSGVGVAEEEESSWTTLKTVLKEWRIWWLAGIWATTNLSMDCLVFWIPLMIESIIYGEKEEWDISGDGEAAERILVSEHAVHVARLASIPFGMAALAMVAVAYSAKRFGDRHWHVAGSMLVAVAALAIMALVKGHVAWLAIAFLTLGCIGVWGNHGPLLSWPAAILKGTTAAAGFSLMKMVGSMAAFVGNSLMGVLHNATGSFTVPLCLMAILLLLGSFLALTFKEPGRSAKIEGSTTN